LDGAKTIEALQENGGEPEKSLRDGERKQCGKGAVGETPKVITGFRPESFGRGRAGTSPKPLVIGHHPLHGSGILLVLDSFPAVAIVQ